jgi:hypothetical protein
MYCYDITQLIFEWYIVACRDVSKLRLGKHIPAASDMQAAVEVLLEEVFSAWFVQRGYKEKN